MAERGGGGGWGGSREPSPGPAFRGGGAGAGLAPPTYPPEAPPPGCPCVRPSAHRSLLECNVEKKLQEGTAFMCSGRL